MEKGGTGRVDGIANNIRNYSDHWQEEAKQDPKIFLYT
jgi:hypothetical protein